MQSPPSVSNVTVEQLFEPFEKFRDRAAWLDARPTFIGGSECAAVLGFHKQESAISTWDGKIHPRDIEPNLHMRIGTALEPLIAEEFGRQHPTIKLYPAGQNQIVRHKAMPFWAATLDYVAFDPEYGWGIVECKWSGLYSAKLWLDEPPDRVPFQVYHQMGALASHFPGEINWGAIAVILGDGEYREYAVYKDPEMDNILQAEYRTFWAHVESRTPPQVTDAKSGTLATLKRLYPNANKGSVLTIDNGSEEFDTWRGIIEEFNAAKLIKTEGEERYEAVRAQIKARIGENEGAEIIGHGGFTWKTIERKGYQVQPTSYRDLRRKA